MAKIRVYLNNCAYTRSLEKRGVLETEQFISTLLKEPFDYTEWSREYFVHYEPDRFLAEAVEYDKNNPV